MTDILTPVTGGDWEPIDLSNGADDGQYVFRSAEFGDSIGFSRAEFEAIRAQQTADLANYAEAVADELLGYLHGSGEDIDLSHEPEGGESIDLSNEDGSDDESDESLLARWDR